jgi:hypothetical protein
VLALQFRPCSKKRFLHLALLLPLFSTPLLAQAQPTEKASVLDFVNQQVAEQLLNQTKALSNPELIKAQADYFRAMYQALISSGFSQEESLKIVVAMASKDE